MVKIAFSLPALKTMRMTYKNQYFIYLQTFIICTSAVILLKYFPIGGKIDLALIQPWLNPDGKFFAKEMWPLSQLSHHYVKYLLIFIYLYIGLTAIKVLPKPWKNLQHWQYAYFFIMVCLSTLLIAQIKKITNHACPWDLVEATPQGYLWHFKDRVGHCFPGGHASSGFALMVGYFLFKDKSKSSALFFLVSALILGFAMGWAQMMRGAHFLSHNLWTAWWIWTLNVVSYVLIYPYFAKKFDDDQTNSLL